MNYGYCTNIHAGTTIDDIVENLGRFSAPIRERFQSQAIMPIGLWLAADTVNEALEPHGFDALRSALERYQLHPGTINAFPYADFHQPVVKHSVYDPGWHEPKRLAYTTDLARLQARLLGEQSTGSLSTVPLGWKTRIDGERLQASLANLSSCARELERLHLETGCFLRLAIEPEPGCFLQLSSDVVRFFDRLRTDAGESRQAVESHIGVCHDVCHAAVMFESQADVLNAYDQAGIAVAKIQFSSAVEVTLDGEATDEARLVELSTFGEKRYLHQTTFRDPDGTVQFFEDLPLAIDAFHKAPRDCVARVHFHVPIHWTAAGSLGTTQDALRDCLRHIHNTNGFVEPTGTPAAVDAAPDMEVETYAWSVLPGSDRSDDHLIESVVAELNWLQHAWQIVQKSA